MGYGVNNSTKLKSEGVYVSQGPFLGFYEGKTQDWNGEGTNTGGSIPLFSVDAPNSSGIKGIQFSTGGLGIEGHAEKTNTFMFFLPKKKDENDPWLIQ